MAKVLAKRAESGIKVRQPLNELRITNYELQKEKELLGLLKEEVNIKKITFGKTLKLDTKITQELKEEGIIREIIRNLQEMRKKAGLKPKDKISILYSGDPGLNEIIVKNKKFIIEETLTQNLSLLKSPKKELETGKEIEIDGIKLWLAIRKTYGEPGRKS